MGWVHVEMKNKLDWNENWWMCHNSEKNQAMGKDNEKIEILVLMSLIHIINDRFKNLIIRDIYKNKKKCDKI